MKLEEAKEMKLEEAKEMKLEEAKEMKLEEAKKMVESIITNMGDSRIDYYDKQAIEVVLQNLDYYEEKIAKYKFMLENDVIGKGKVIKKIEELNKMYNETKDVKVKQSIWWRIQILKEILQEGGK